MRCPGGTAWFSWGDGGSTGGNTPISVIDSGVINIGLIGDMMGIFVVLIGIKDAWGRTVGGWSYVRVKKWYLRLPHTRRRATRLPLFEHNVA
jgi:hypothetical protein